jgi:hypothetical protein
LVEASDLSPRHLGQQQGELGPRGEVTDEIGPVGGEQPGQFLAIERAVAVGVVPGEEPFEPGQGEAPVPVVDAGVASMLAGVDALCGPR